MQWLTGVLECPADASQPALNMTMEKLVLVLCLLWATWLVIVLRRREERSRELPAQFEALVRQMRLLDLQRQIEATQEAIKKLDGVDSNFSRN